MLYDTLEKSELILISIDELFYNVECSILQESEANIE